MARDRFRAHRRPGPAEEAGPLRRARARVPQPARQGALGRARAAQGRDATLRADHDSLRTNSATSATVNPSTPAPARAATPRPPCSAPMRAARPPSRGSPERPARATPRSSPAAASASPCRDLTALRPLTSRRGTASMYGEPAPSRRIRPQHECPALVRVLIVVLHRTSEARGSSSRSRPSRRGRPNGYVYTLVRSYS